jgi:rubrerythrin
MEDEPIRAFDMSRTINHLSLTKEATDALTLFLFEESYKEYELIMIYNYFQAHSDDAFLNRIFQIMIDESFFHLRSFGEMMAEMGLLGVPRVIHKSLYQRDDLGKFLLEGIEEEIAAKQQCIDLSNAVARESKELAGFFDFINFQEDYHVALMEEALEHYEKRQNG